MSNTDNIYNILNNFNKIAKDAPAPVAATPKAKTKLQESMEQVVNEKYMGFKKTVAAIKKSGSAEDPEAVAAAIGRKKYGKEKFQKAAAAGKKLGEGQDATTYTVAYKDPKKPGKSRSTQVKATSAAEAKAAFQKWDTTNRFTYLGSRPDVDKVYEELDPEHVEYLKRQADISRSTGLAVGDRVTLKDRPGFEGEIVHDWGGGDFTISGSGGGMSQSKNHRANARLIQKIKEDHGPENPEAPVNYGEYDREGDMAKDDLYTIDSAAEELYSILQADDNLPEWVQSKITKAVDYIDTARDYMKAQSYGQGMAEGFDDMIKDVNRKAKEKGTGKFDKKEISTGTVYTRKYNPKSGETDDTENVSAEKRGRGRPKKSAFEDMSTIDKMIAESFGELFEGTSRPVGDPVSKAAPTAPGVGSGIRVTPMPTLATTPKPATGMGSIQGGVWTAKPPKPGEQGVAIPQGLDEVNAEDSGSEPWTGQGLSGSAYKDDRNPLVVRSKLPMGANMTGSTAGPQPYRVKISGYNKPGEQGEPLAPEMDSMNSMDPGTPQPQPTAFDPAPVARPDLDEADAEMEGMRKLAGLKGNDGNLANNAKPYKKVTRRDVIQGAQGKDEMGGKEHDLEEGGSDYDKIRDKIQWLQGAPNYLSRREAKETAYYTKDTDPVWDDYRDDADEVGENLEVRANPAGASSAEQAKKIGAQFPQQNGKEPNLAYKIGEDEVEENLIVVPNLSGAGSVAAAKKLGAMMPAKPGEKDPISTNEEDMEEGGAFGLAVTNAKRDGIQPGETFKVGGKEYDLKEGDAALNQMRRIAGLKECDMSPISGMASDMEKQQGSMNISTNQSSDGTKSVTITAAGDAASDLMQMLKLAGMGGGAAPAVAAEPEIVVVAQDGEETMEEEKDPRYQASTTPDEQVAPVQALTKGGNGDVAGQEKTMKPGGYQFGDNNLAMQESLSTQLMKEYNSIKVKK